MDKYLLNINDNLSCYDSVKLPIHRNVNPTFKALVLGTNFETIITNTVCLRFFYTVPVRLYVRTELWSHLHVSDTTKKCSRIKRFKRTTLTVCYSIARNLKKSTPHSSLLPYYHSYHDKDITQNFNQNVTRKEKIKALEKLIKHSSSEAQNILDTEQ